RHPDNPRRDRPHTHSSGMSPEELKPSPIKDRSFPVRRSAGRLYSLNRADRFHDREPVPVHPDIAELPILHLVPRTGGRPPPFASWSDPSKVALVRGGGAHPNGDKIALGNHLLYGHFEVRKCLDGAGSDLPQALIRHQFFDVRRIVLDEHLIDEPQNDSFVLLV